MYQVNAKKGDNENEFDEAERFAKESEGRAGWAIAHQRPPQKGRGASDQRVSRRRTCGVGRNDPTSEVVRRPAECEAEAHSSLVQ